jgi:hypothetical protein
MEDRITPYLYLELSDAEPEVYAKERVDGVLDLAGVERGVWWRNLNYQRKDFEPDFVFRVEDFKTLASYEVDASFTPPEPPAGLRTLHFQHYPRPAQGFLTGEPTPGLMLVLISAREGSDGQALRDWGDFVHLPPLAVGNLGFSMITPYERVGGGSPLFMHFYETVTSDAEAALQAETNDFPLTLGGYETAEYKHWQLHDDLVVDYINTFERAGDAVRR